MNTLLEPRIKFQKTHLYTEREPKHLQYRWSTDKSLHWQLLGSVDTEGPFNRCVELWPSAHKHYGKMQFYLSYFFWFYIAFGAFYDMIGGKSLFLLLVKPVKVCICIITQTKSHVNQRMRTQWGQLPLFQWWVKQSQGQAPLLSGETSPNLCLWQHLSPHLRKQAKVISLWVSCTMAWMVRYWNIHSLD